MLMFLQVAFDPLDGSSIFDANFAVGSIFGVWPGGTPLGQTGRDQVAAAYSVYGPRTLLILAIPSGSSSSSRAAACGSQQQQQQQQCSAAQQQQQDGHPHHQQQQGSISEAFDVLEFVLSDKRWRLRRVHTKLGDKNNVAPANIRAAAGNEAYQKLLHAWITNGCKLRYSGGMVPDVHHMLAKVGAERANSRHKHGSGSEHSI
jgi:fructose-1,6-bisphosphatase